MAFVEWVAFRWNHRPLGRLRAQDADTALLEAYNRWGSAAAYVRSDASVKLGPTIFRPVEE